MARPARYPREEVISRINRCSGPAATRARRWRAWPPRRGWPRPRSTTIFRPARRAWRGGPRRAAPVDRRPGARAAVRPGDPRASSRRWPRRSTSSTPAATKPVWSALFSIGEALAHFQGRLQAPFRDLIAAIAGVLAEAGLADGRARAGRRRRHPHPGRAGRLPHARRLLPFSRLLRRLPDDLWPAARAVRRRPTLARSTRGRHAAQPFLPGRSLLYRRHASWGAMFPVMTGALTRIDPFTFTCMRYTIAGLAFLALLLAKEGRSGPQPQGRARLAGLVLRHRGLRRVRVPRLPGPAARRPRGALTASIMMATQPLLGLLVNWAFRKVVPPVYSFLFILLSFCGVTLVITKGHVLNLLSMPQSYGADGLIVLGALCWVFYTVGAAFFPKWSPYKYTTLTTLLGLTSVFAITAALWWPLHRDAARRRGGCGHPAPAYMAFGAGPDRGAVLEFRQQDPHPAQRRAVHGRRAGDRVRHLGASRA